MHYTIYSIHHALYNIQYTSCIIQYTVYITHYTIYSIHHALYNIQYTSHIIQYTVYIMHYTIYSMHHTSYNIQYTSCIIHRIIIVHHTMDLLPEYERERGQYRLIHAWTAQPWGHVSEPALPVYKRVRGAVNHVLHASKTTHPVSTKQMAAFCTHRHSTNIPAWLHPRHLCLDSNVKRFVVILDWFFILQSEIFL